jgi:hypothetical protein
VIYMQRITPLQEYIGPEVLDTVLENALQHVPEEQRGFVKATLRKRVAGLDVPHERDMSTIEQPYDSFTLVYDKRKGSENFGNDSGIIGGAERVCGLRASLGRPTIFHFTAYAGETSKGSWSPRENTIDAKFLGETCQAVREDGTLDSYTARDMQLTPSREQPAVLLVTAGGLNSDWAMQTREAFARKNFRLGVIYTNREHVGGFDVFSGFADLYVSPGQKLPEMIEAYAKAILGGGAVPPSLTKLPAQPRND